MRNYDVGTGNLVFIENISLHIEKVYCLKALNRVSPSFLFYTWEPFVWGPIKVYSDIYYCQSIAPYPLPHSLPFLLSILPLYTPCFSPVFPPIPPLFFPYTSPVFPLYLFCFSPIPPLFFPYTSSVFPLYLLCFLSLFIYFVSVT